MKNNKPQNKIDKQLSYPQAHETAQVDNYHGTMVPDPFRVLENPQAKTTRNWLKAQKKLTTKYLDAIPERQAIKDHVTKLRDFKSPAETFEIDGKLYWWLRPAGQSQSVLYTGKKAFGKNGKVVFDPNKLSSDGSVTMTDYAYSPDDQYIAFGTSEGGSDWEELRVLDIGKEQILADRLQGLRSFGVSWSTAGDGFYYRGYDVPDEADKHLEITGKCKLYYHQLGTDQCHDALIYDQSAHPGEMGFAQEINDGRLLLGSIIDRSNGRLSFLVKKLDGKKRDFVVLLKDGGTRCTAIKSGRSKFWFLTNFDAPNGRVIEVDMRKPGKTKEILPERSEVLQSLVTTRGRLVASYLKDAHSTIKEFTRKGKFLRDVPLPGIGCVDNLEGSDLNRIIHFDFESFVHASSLYRYKLKSGRTKLVEKSKINYESDNYICEQVFYTSKDGTRVPMFLNYKKGMKRDSATPTYLYGYGGFAHAEVPVFSTLILTLMDLGFIFAVANIRGGGEYGEQWHQSGIKEKKQNSFDDFISAAEWLIANGYTNSSKLAIVGASNGGLLVGAAMTQRPELFAAVIAEVGVMDMLRFNKFTCGRGWQREYGSPDNVDDFRVIYAYSPLHRLQAGTTYPATLVMTGEYDDRVVPAHSFKFTAALQKVQAGDNPILLRLSDNSGHHGGQSEAARIGDITDKVAFLVYCLGVDITTLKL